jgi:hypothetical protein
MSVSKSEREIEVSVRVREWEITTVSGQNLYPASRRSESEGVRGLEECTEVLKDSR